MFQFDKTKTYSTPYTRSKEIKELSKLVKKLNDLNQFVIKCILYIHRAYEYEGLGI